MKLIITGGLGFVGSWLVKLLLKNPAHHICIIDDLSTGIEDNVKYVRDQIHEIHISKIQDFNAFSLDLDSYDILIHLAASVGVKNIVENPYGHMKNNLDSTEAALELAANRNCKRLLFSSTSEVYGSGMQARFCEEDDFRIGQSFWPRWSYAASKVVDEFMVNTFCDMYNIDRVIMRFFNVVGPGQQSQYGMVLPRFINNARLNLPLTIYDGGKNVRTFTSVFDCIKVIKTFIEKQEAFYQVYNIGSNNVTTIDNLANLVIHLCNSDSIKTYIDSKKVYGANFADSAVRIPNIERLMTVTRVDKFQSLCKIITSMFPVHGKVLEGIEG